MKIKNLLCAAALSIAVTSNAQFPQSIIFNTANNTFGGVVGVGSQDLIWRCSPVFGGPYNLIPEQVTPAGGWHLGNSAPFFPPNAEWISYPNTCVAGSPSEDHCGCVPYMPCTDQYYEYLFNLPVAGGPFVLPFTMMADNLIAQVWLNNVPVYTAPPAQTAPLPYYGGYLYTGFQAGSEVYLNIPGPFNYGGLNSLRVQVRSGINSAGSGWTGFVCFNSGCYACAEEGGGGSGGGDPKDRTKMNQSGATDDNNTGAILKLSDKNTLVLNQNVPNPFAESTVISYSIPQTFSRAQLIFRTSEGMLVKTLEITRAGKGSVTIFADDLSRGTYSYSLVIDGKEADSKRMVKE